jgi:hypothetical protein
MRVMWERRSARPDVRHSLLPVAVVVGVDCIAFVDVGRFDNFAVVVHHNVKAASVRIGPRKNTRYPISDDMTVIT